jgi:hypothetical protein
MESHKNNPSREKSPLKYLFLSFFVSILFFVLVIPCHADWESYQSAYNSIGRIGDEVGNWNQSVTDYTSIPEAADYQPIAVDIDPNNDGLEIISSDNTYLQAHDSDGVLIEDHSLSCTITTPITYSNNMLLFICDDMKAYAYNLSNSSFSHIRNSTINRSSLNAVNENATGKNIKCLSDDPKMCYFMNDYGNVCEWNTDTAGISCTEAKNTTTSGDYKAALGTMSGKDVFVTKSASNELMVFDIDSQNLYTSFDTDGFKTLTSSGITNNSNPIVYNWNQAGDDEIIFTRLTSDAGNTDGFFEILKSDGSDYGGFFTGSPYRYKRVTTTGGESMSIQPVIALRGSTRYVCGGGVSNVFNNLSCMAFGETYSYLNSSMHTEGSNPFEYNLFTADMDGDGNEDLITLENINNPTGSDIYGFPAADDYNIIGSDLKGDGDIQVLLYSDSNMRLVSSGFVNSAPILNTRNYGQNYISPVCLDTSVTFTAKECGSEPCHYTNDGSEDQERLVSDCGINSTQLNGTYDLSNPELSCYYGQTGTFNFNVYLQDEFNPTDKTEYQEKTIYVINGTAGIDCNLPVDSDTLTGKNETDVSADDEITSESEIQYVVDTVTSQSDFLKAILVLIFSIMLVFGLAKYNIRSPLIFALSVFLLWIGLAMLGLLSWIYVMIFAIVSIGLGAVFFVKGNNGE